jgi:hypothetical protein
MKHPFKKILLLSFFAMAVGSVSFAQGSGTEGTVTEKQYCLETGITQKATIAFTDFSLPEFSVAVNIEQTPLNVTQYAMPTPDADIFIPLVSVANNWRCEKMPAFNVPLVIGEPLAGYVAIHAPPALRA